MSYFRKVTDDAGVESFVEVDLASEELPEEVVKAQKPYKTVLSESIERRKKLATLLEKPVTEENEEESKATPTQKPEPVVQVDPDKLYEDFKARLAREAKEREEALKKEQETITSLVKEFGLQPSDADIIADAKNPRAAAEKLAKRPYHFDEQSASGDPAKKQIDDAIGGALKKLGLDD